MTVHRLASRLARLEARRAPSADQPYIYQEPPPGWTEEVLRLLWEHGLFTSVEDMLEQVIGISDTETIEAVKELLLTGDNPEKETYGGDV